MDAMYMIYILFINISLSPAGHIKRLNRMHLAPGDAVRPGLVKTVR